MARSRLVCSSPKQLYCLPILPSLGLNTHSPGPSSSGPPSPVSPLSPISLPVSPVSSHSPGTMKHGGLPLAPGPSLQPATAMMLSAMPRWMFGNEDIDSKLRTALSARQPGCLLLLRRRESPMPP
jgi:hypothetical protein